MMCETRVSQMAHLKYGSLGVLELRLIFNCSASSGQCALTKFQYHECLFRGIIFTANAVELGWREAKAWVVIGMTQYHYYVVTKTVAFFEASSN